MKNKDIDNEEYRDLEEHRLSVLKRTGIIILVILGIMIIFLFLKSCTKTEDNDLSKTLLEAGKEYYEYNEHLLPTAVGDCKNVTLTTLSQEGLINKAKYADCGNDSTYVKVCKLESGKYHFVAIMDCVNEKTDDLYGSWKEGTEKDIISDSSDIKFFFQVQYLDTTNANVGNSEEYWEDEIPYSKYKTEAVTKYYRYKDLQYIWNITSKRYYPGDATSIANIKEYYITSPSADYKYKDNENTKVSKYFSTTEGKIYWVDESGNRNFALTAPDNVYIYPDNPVYQTGYATRVWTETSKPVTADSTQFWYCSSPNDENQIRSTVPCENNVNNYTITERMIYSCDGGLTEVGQNGVCYQCTDGKGLRTDRSSCGYYSDYGNYSKTPCDTSSDLCTTKIFTAYQWYKLVDGERKYYPSNSTTASGEKTYYGESPVTSLIKDVTTTTTGWKWYKKLDTETTSYYSTSPQTGATKTDTSRWTDFTKWSTAVPQSLGSEGTRMIETRNKIKLKQITGDTDSWLNYNEKYMELDSILTSLQAKGYKVYSLDDITSSGELKYKVKLFVRNKEVE